MRGFLCFPVARFSFRGDVIHVPLTSWHHCCELLPVPEEVAIKLGLCASVLH